MYLICDSAGKVHVLNGDVTRIRFNARTNVNATTASAGTLLSLQGSQLLGHRASTFRSAWARRRHVQHFPPAAQRTRHGEVRVGADPATRRHQGRSVVGGDLRRAQGGAPVQGPAAAHLHDVPVHMRRDRSGLSHPLAHLPQAAEHVPVGPRDVSRVHRVDAAQDEGVLPLARSRGAAVLARTQRRAGDQLLRPANRDGDVRTTGLGDIPTAGTLPATLHVIVARDVDSRLPRPHRQGWPGGGLLRRRVDTKRHLGGADVHQGRLHRTRRGRHERPVLSQGRHADDAGERHREGLQLRRPLSPACHLHPPTLRDALVKTGSTTEPVWLR